MPTLRMPYVYPGLTTDASDQDDFLDDLASDSANIGTINTTPEWISVAHFDWIGNPVVLDKNQMDNSSTYTENSHTYAIVDSGVEPATVALTAPIAEGDVVRAHATVLVNDVSPNDPTNDTYSLRLVLYHSGGSTDTIGIAGTWSMRTQSSDVGSVAGTVATGGPAENIDRQRVSLSAIYIHSGATITPTQIALQVVIPEGSTTMEITRYSLQAWIHGA